MLQALYHSYHSHPRRHWGIFFLTIIIVSVVALLTAPSHPDPQILALAVTVVMVTLRVLSIRLDTCHEAALPRSTTAELDSVRSAYLAAIVKNVATFGTFAAIAFVLQRAVHHLGDPGLGNAVAPRVVYIGWLSDVIFLLAAGLAGAGVALEARVTDRLRSRALELTDRSSYPSSPIPTSLGETPPSIAPTPKLVVHEVRTLRAIRGVLVLALSLVAGYAYAGSLAQLVTLDPRRIGQLLVAATDPVLVVSTLAVVLFTILWIHRNQTLNRGYKELIGSLLQVERVLDPDRTSSELAGEGGWDSYE